MTKRCTKCGEQKEDNMFTKGSYYCKDCVSIIYKKYYEQNKEKIIKQANTYYINNKSNICSKNKIYYIKNKQSKLEYSKKYRDEHKTTIKDYKQTYERINKVILREKRYNHRDVHWIRDSLNKHKSRGILILTNEDEIKLYKDITHCNICGGKIYIEHIGKTTRKSPTIDRINNDNFMDINNIQIVCHQCNVMKGTMDMLNYITYLNNIRTKTYNVPQLIEIKPNKKTVGWSWSRATYYGHKRKGYSMKITVAQINSIYINTKKCPICGCNMEHGQKNSHGRSPSLDRINNKCGELALGDVWIICHRCNTIKQQFTLDEWKEYAELVCNRFGIV